MSNFSRLLATVLAAVLIGFPLIAGVSPRSHLLDEDAALALLERTLKYDGVYKDPISLDCVTYGTEQTTDAYFQFVLRENHNAKCGGDPETSPGVDRYRVYRPSGKIQWLDRVEGSWRLYKPSQIK